jgi:hypothetical protein
MDANTVYQLFVSTYHPDPNVHKQAELNIRGVSLKAITVRSSLLAHNCFVLLQIEGSNGFLPVVLQILASEESELGARQAGALSHI